MRHGILFAFLILPPWIACQTAIAMAQNEPFAEAEEFGELPELETDRDAFTPASSTAGQGLTIVESSYTFIDNRQVAETHSFPELLIRHGVCEWIELRLGWNFEVGGTGDIVSGTEGPAGVLGDEIERESQILYGFKLAISEQEGWMPRSVAILQGYTPTSGEAPETDIVIAYVFGWELTNGWRLDSSLRYGTEHSAEDALNQWAPSVVVRIPLSEQWHAHVEYFGIYTQGADEDVSRAFFSPGVHYLVTPNLELGCRVGWGLTEDAPNFFSNVGVGWRF